MSYKVTTSNLSQTPLTNSESGTISHNGKLNNTSTTVSFPPNSRVLQQSKVVQTITLESSRNKSSSIIPKKLSEYRFSQEESSSVLFSNIKKLFNKAMDYFFGKKEVEEMTQERELQNPEQKKMQRPMNQINTPGLSALNEANQKIILETLAHPAPPTQKTMEQLEKELENKRNERGGYDNELFQVRIQRNNFLFNFPENPSINDYKMRNELDIQMANLTNKRDFANQQVQDLKQQIEVLKAGTKTTATVQPTATAKTASSAHPAPPTQKTMEQLEKELENKRNERGGYDNELFQVKMQINKFLFNFPENPSVNDYKMRDELDKQMANLTNKRDFANQQVQDLKQQIEVLKAGTKTTATVQSTPAKPASEQTNIDRLDNRFMSDVKRLDNAQQTLKELASKFSGAPAEAQAYIKQLQDNISRRKGMYEGIKVMMDARNKALEMPKGDQFRKIYEENGDGYKAISKALIELEMVIENIESKVAQISKKAKEMEL